MSQSNPANFFTQKGKSRTMINDKKAIIVESEQNFAESVCCSMEQRKDRISSNSTLYQMKVEPNRSSSL